MNSHFTRCGMEQTYLLVFLPRCFEGRGIDPTMPIRIRSLQKQRIIWCLRILSSVSCSSIFELNPYIYSARHCHGRIRYPLWKGRLRVAWLVARQEVKMAENSTTNPLLISMIPTKLCIMVYSFIHLKMTQEAKNAQPGRSKTSKGREGCVFFITWLSSC